MLIYIDIIPHIKPVICPFSPIYRLARPSAEIIVFDADATLDDYMEQAWYAVIVRKG